MKEIKTNNGKKGGWLVGKRHYDKSGKPLGGIKAVVTDAGGKPVELEGGEVIINREASKKYWKELSKINQSAGNGVAIGPPAGLDEDPEEYKEGGRVIEFNPNHIPNKWILSYAEKIKAKHPEIWSLGGNIFGNEAFNNLKRVADRGHWLDSEEWMYIKWRSYVARHQRDYRIEGVVAMLKWVDKVEKGWPYMKELIEEKIDKLSKKGWKHKADKMKDGGNTNNSNNKDENKKRTKKESIIEEAISYISRGVSAAKEKQPTGISEQKIKNLESQFAFDFAIKKGIWHGDLKNLPKPIGGGGNENSLYYDENTGIIYKSNNLFNSNFSILEYLNYLLYHNRLFPNTKYNFFGFIGFSNNYPSITSAIPFIEPIVTQKYILGESASQDQIENSMLKIGFEKINEHTFKKDSFIVSDLRPRNVIKDSEGDIFVIDNIIKPQSKMNDGGSVAKTPAPKKDRIVGSDVNKPKSSSSAKSGSSIKFSKELTNTISDKVKEHNSNNLSKKVTLAVAKAVVRRGMGAYSSSHRPTITGGKPNDRTAWGLARLNAFFYKIEHGKSKSGKYTQDDDLIEELGLNVQKMNQGGELAMGIKAEHEHSKTISKFKRKGVSDLDVETAIAKDHLKEDPHYYSKLAKMEGKKYAKGGALQIGSTGILKGRTDKNVQIVSMTDKIVTYLDIESGKKIGLYKDKFIEKFIEKGTIETDVEAETKIEKISKPTLEMPTKEAFKSDIDYVSLFELNLDTTSEMMKKVTDDQLVDDQIFSFNKIVESMGLKS